MNKRFILLLLLLISINGFSQSATYENNIYNPSIKTVEFYNTQKKPSFPLIKLNSVDQVELEFDDLRGGTQSFYYTLEHCDGDWNSSNLSPTEYLKNFNEDKILDYTYSSATLQKYTHYTLKLPNENISPKISGNYILKVYEDDDPTKLILTRRLYVLNNKISITADVTASGNLDSRASNQKIYFQINYGALNVQNPNSDIRTWIMQNERYETGQFTTQPQYIRGNQLIYGDLGTNDFTGRNEFRHFDFRSLKQPAERVSQIKHDTSNSVIFLTDQSRNQHNYVFTYDNNGNYFIINKEGTNAVNDADYAHLYFSMACNKTADDGSLYLVGKFNDYKLDDRSKLDYDPKGKFFTHLYLKQGVYDYLYVWVDNSTQKHDDIIFEGSYFETENDYQILVYYKPPAARWEELVGYKLMNTVKK